MEKLHKQRNIYPKVIRDWHQPHCRKITKKVVYFDRQCSLAGSEAGKQVQVNKPFKKNHYANAN